MGQKPAMEDANKTERFAASFPDQGVPEEILNSIWDRWMKIRENSDFFRAQRLEKLRE